MPDEKELDEVGLEAAANQITTFTPGVVDWKFATDLARLAITAYLNATPTHKLYVSARVKLVAAEQEVERLRGIVQSFRWIENDDGWGHLWANAQRELDALAHPVGGAEDETPQTCRYCGSYVTTDSEFHCEEERRVRGGDVLA